MKRPYRCYSSKCLKRNDSNVVHLDPSNVADETCTHCGKNNYERVTLIHLIEESEDGPIIGSKHNRGKRFTFMCDYAVKQYNMFLDGARLDPVKGGWRTKESTCYDCLVNNGCSFDLETNEFLYEERLVGD